MILFLGVNVKAGAQCHIEVDLVGGLYYNMHFHIVIASYHSKNRPYHYQKWLATDLVRSTKSAFILF